MTCVWGRRGGNGRDGGGDWRAGDAGWPGKRRWHGRRSSVIRSGLFRFVQPRTRCVSNRENRVSKQQGQNDEKIGRHG